MWNKKSPQVGKPAGFFAALGCFTLFLDRQGPHRPRHLVWSWASNQSGAGVGTHCAWPWCRGTYCGKVFLP